MKCNCSQELRSTTCAHHASDELGLINIVFISLFNSTPGRQKCFHKNRRHILYIYDFNKKKLNRTPNKLHVLYLISCNQTKTKRKSSSFQEHTSEARAPAAGWCPSPSAAVDGPAVAADLPALAGEHADAPHLADGVPELAEEVGLPGEAVDHARGAAVGEQRGVGGEEAPPELEVDEVVRVEPGGAPGVHGHRRGVVGRRRRAAPRPELRRVRRVQRRVGAGGGVGAGAAAQARREGVAVGHADRVRACTCISQAETIFFFFWSPEQNRLTVLACNK